MRNTIGQFIAGAVSENRQPIGTIRIRTRYKRKGLKRNYIKIGIPNTWVENARAVWEAENGLILKGMGIHHIDGNSLNDDISNLRLVSKAEHLAIHRPEFAERALAGFIAARRRLRWSTKSLTKTNRRHDLK